MVLSDLSHKLTSSLHKFAQKTRGVNVSLETEVDALLSEIGDALIYADVSVLYVQDLKQKIRNDVLDESVIKRQTGMDGGFQKLGGNQKQRVIQRAVVNHLSNLLAGEIKPFKPIKGKQSVVLFVGLQGAGKTTTITKYAHFYKQKGYKCAMVCADTFRAGAFDQLKQNSTKIHCPFYGSYTETDPVVIAEEGVSTFRQDRKENYDLILVDSSGRHRQESALFDEMQQLSESIQPDATILVMDSHIGQAGYRQAEAFADASEIGAVILTKMDDSSGTSTKGGGALSAVAATGAPVVFLGTGERFEDFDEFRSEGFVSKLLGLGDITGLMENITDQFLDIEAMKRLAQSDMEGGNGGENGTGGPKLDLTDCLKGETKNLFTNITKGKFTFRNLCEMFNSMRGMGSMSSIMSMMPGMMQQNGMDSKQHNEKIRKFLIIMDSMTDSELDGLVDISKDESRIKRLVKGSGCYNNVGMVRVQQPSNAIQSNSSDPKNKNKNSQPTPAPNPMQPTPTQQQFFPDGSGDIRTLFSEHTRISEMVSHLGGTMFGAGDKDGNGGGIDLSNPNPVQMMKGMNNMMKNMDPNMKAGLQSMMGNMGGMVENMMEKMGMGKPPPGMVDSVIGAMSGANNDNPNDPMANMMQQMMNGNMDPDMENMMNQMCGGGGPGGMNPMAMLQNMKGGGKGQGMPQLPGTGGNSQSGGPGSGTGTGTQSSNNNNLTTSASGKFQILKEKTKVRLQGLQSRPQENGKEGTILGFDESKNRYFVGDIEGVETPLALKPSNFVQKEVKVKVNNNDTTGASSNGNSEASGNTNNSNSTTTVRNRKNSKKGKKGSTSSTNSSTGDNSNKETGTDSSTSDKNTSSSSSWILNPIAEKIESLFFPSSEPKESVPFELSNKATGEKKTITSSDDFVNSSIELIPNTTCVRVHGLQSEKGRVWNEYYGTILGFDKDSGRYCVDMGQGCQLKIQLKNMAL